MTLIVLDLNGVLAQKKSRKNWKNATVFENWKINQCTFELLDYLSKNNIDYAVWTSTTFVRAKPLVDYIFENYQPKFVWYRDDTDYDAEFGLHHTLKNVEKIRRIFPQYANEKIFIVDDSAKKLRFNLQSDNIIVENFEQVFEQIKFYVEDFSV